MRVDRAATLNNPDLIFGIDTEAIIVFCRLKARNGPDVISMALKRETPVALSLRGLGNGTLLRYAEIGTSHEL